MILPDESAVGDKAVVLGEPAGLPGCAINRHVARFATTTAEQTKLPNITASRMLAVEFKQKASLHALRLHIVG